ncbi:MAG: hypothetical protein KJ949_02210, partial [Nanoarchaeota archaeon]|nr:hypothetical protein [Nanoarchaeota archaeon]
PEGWRPGLESEIQYVDVADYNQKRIVELNEQYVKSIRRTAVDDSEIEKMKKLASYFEAAQKDFDEKQKVSEKLSKERAEYRKKPVPRVPCKEDAQQCPYCHLKLILR